MGGILVSEQAIPFKVEMYELVQTLTTQAQNAGVEIRLNTPVTPEYAEAEKPDALIIAIGSEPLLPPIDGINRENVILVNDYYREKERVCENVVVLGGGLAGSEIAIHLANEGKTVHLVEMREEVAPDANVRQRPILLKKLSESVTVHTGCRAQQITSEGVLCIKTTESSSIEATTANSKTTAPIVKKHLIPGRTVICAAGQRSCSAAADRLRDCAPYTIQIGDCVKPSTITTAIYQGYHAALDI